MPPGFHPFTVPHLAALVAGAACTSALILAGRRGGRSHQVATGILAFVNLAVYGMSQFAWQGYEDPGIDNLLPFHLCDVAAVIAGFALLTRRPLLCELTYFWGLAATLQGLVTPAIRIGFPGLPFVTFFIHHFAVVVAALYLPLADGWRPPRPWWKAPVRALLLANIYLAFAMVVNRWLGSNFAFAARKPDNPSLLDHLGPWPWYLLALQGIALVFFLILSLPFMRLRREGK